MLLVDLVLLVIHLKHQISKTYCSTEQCSGWGTDLLLLATGEAKESMATSSGARCCLQLSASISNRPKTQDVLGEPVVKKSPLGYVSQLMRLIKWLKWIFLCFEMIPRYCLLFLSTLSHNTQLPVRKQHAFRVVSCCKSLIAEQKRLRLGFFFYYFSTAGWPMNHT